MKSRRGIVIPTALFAVLAIFALVTAIHLMVTQNFQVTRYGHVKTQARYLAHTACQIGLQQLNEDPTFEGNHRGEGSRLVTPFPDGTAETWVEATTDPNVVLVRGRGTTETGFAAAMGLTVRKKQPLVGDVFARPTGSGATTFFSIGADRLASGTAAPGDWQPLPPVPNVFYDRAGNVVDNRESASTHDDYARNVAWAAADNRGNLYAVHPRTSGDTVLKLSADTRTWGLLPAVPASYYKADGTLVERDATAHRLTDMASDGGNRLFVRYAREGIDTIFTLDQSASAPAWKPLPPTPAVVYDAHGKGRLVPDRFAGSLTSLASDSDGVLYARQPRDGVDTLYRIDAAHGGAWEALPAAPRAYYARTAGGVQLIQDGANAAHNLKGLSVGSDDKALYAVFSRDGIDTLLKYELGAKQWSVLPAVPADYLRNARSDTYGSGASHAATNVVETAADGDSHLYVRWNREGVDSLFGYDLHTQTYRMLPAVPNQRWKPTGPTPTLVDNTERSGNGRIQANIAEIAGGGRPDPAGRMRYVRTGSF